MKNILLFTCLALIIIFLSGCQIKPKAEVLLEMDQFTNCSELTVSEKKSGITINCKR